MPTLKQGDLIKDRDGDTRKVMEVYGTILFISYTNHHNRHCFTSDEETLKAEGYTWDTPAWEPAMNEKYWCVGSCCDAICSNWDNDKNDHARKNFLGIYETKALCEAAILEIRRKLGK